MRQKKTKFSVCMAAGLCLSVLFHLTAAAEELTESRVFTVMGTDASIRIYGAQGVADPIMDMLAEIENDRLSWRSEDSEISRLNASAGREEGFALSEKTGYYLSQALELSEKSSGAFDVTVGELSKLWGLGTADAKVPDREEIEALMPGVGYEKVKTEGNCVFMEENTSVDLGAVGKGIGCQEAEELLTEYQASGALVTVGGSILMYGEKPDSSEWKIGIANPRSETGDDYLGSLALEGTQTVSTSGDYEKYLIENGKRYHHILDPRTGYPAESGLISVTVVCREGWLSDGLSTACFVLGYEKSLELLKAYDAQAVFVDADYRVCVTDGLKDAFTLTGTAYEQVDEL